VPLTPYKKQPLEKSNQSIIAYQQYAVNFWAAQILETIRKTRKDNFRVFRLCVMYITHEEEKQNFS